MRTWLFAAVAVVAAMTGPAVRGDTIPSPAEAEHGFTPSLAAAYITDVQKQLTARGYYAGVMDGRMNSALRTAISVYQSDVGMRVTGVPDLAVVNMLRFGPDVKATIQPLGTQPPASQPPTSQPAAATPPPAAAASPEPRRQTVPARTAGVPPYEAPEPYRYPTPAPAPEAEEQRTADALGCPPAQPNAKPRRAEVKGALKAEEPPLPKAAPQHPVVASPLPAG